MTFEEFLRKKKIDQIQLQAAEPVLFSEFQSHFSQMGEKSFDHSKKFLFNKLRRTYHLKEELKPVPAKEVIQTNELASQAEPLLSPSVEATVYTPRFKASVNKPLAEPSETKVPDNSEQAKPAFKPRFKPGVTTTSPELKPDLEFTVPVPDVESSPKPAYIPKFKSAIKTSAESPQQSNDVLMEVTEDRSAPINDAGLEKPESIPTSEIQHSTSPRAEDEVKQPAYKPKFKPAMLKPKSDD